MKQARSRVRDRENLRFERTRLFGRVRRIVVEIGKRLHQEAMLDSPDDVFCLTISEVMGAYEGSFPRQELAETVTQRKQEQAKFNAPPPDRFETRGSLENYTYFTSAGTKQSPSGDELSGSS